MSFTLNTIGKMLGLAPKPLTEQQKLQRILTAAVDQKAEMYIVFSQRLARPVPIRGRFTSLDADRLSMVLDTTSVYDAWKNDPCSVYFSVRCAELSGSYAFTARVLEHYTRDNITRAVITLPEKYINRQVRRFERISPDDAVVQQMEVWKLRPLSPDDLPLPVRKAVPRLQEPPPLSSLLPVHLHNLGPADYQSVCGKRNCGLINVSAGGARLRLHAGPNQPCYAEGDHIMLMLALCRPKLPPLPVALAGICLGVADSCLGQDMKMRFIYWDSNQTEDALQWAPVNLRGVAPLFDWVTLSLGLNEDGSKGVETTFEDKA